MNLPECLTLTEQQKDKLSRFVEFIVNKYPKELEEEEDCFLSSPFVFEIQWTGIGDEIAVKAFSETCSLSIDDDGEISEDEWRMS